MKESGSFWDKRRDRWRSPICFRKISRDFEGDMFAGRWESMKAINGVKNRKPECLNETCNPPNNPQ
jgi:hypothetical protein